MKSAKKARLLSIFLTTALVIGSLPSALGIIASADGTAIDYSAVVNQTHLKINDYYSNLKMYDGVGLEVSNGTVVTDKDWYGQLANGDADVKASGAYAVYNILPGSAFSADFTDTTAIGKMKIYFSEDMVDWFLADTVAVGKTLTVAKTPDYAKYAKIQWPTSSSEKNGLKSVTLTAGEKYAADKRIDYAVNALDGAVQNGIDSDSYLVKYGIWNTSDNLYYFDSGIIQPDYSGIENTTDENPFDGYVVYKAQPGTHFGLTVTSDRAASQFAELLGKAPLDWKVEIYGSLDGVNYRALNIDPVYSARYSNSFNPEDPDDGTRRSADYNFIVPNDVVFIKCKFPQTKDLSSLNKDEIAGNDLFEINKVEFTQLKYDYCKLSNDDYYIKGNQGGNAGSRTWLPVWKFKDANMQHGGTGGSVGHGSRDIYMFRLAETYLIAAEAAVKANDNAKALMYINFIRQRASTNAPEGGLPLYSGTITIDDVLDERALELFGEVSRWNDLTRTGKLAERVLEYNWDVSNINGAVKTELSASTNAKFSLRPIPLAWLNSLSNGQELGNNPGWE